MDSNNTVGILQPFNATLDEWINVLDHYSFDMLCRKPAAKQWSLGQVYVHLIADTGYFVERMTAALADSQHAGKHRHEDATRMLDKNEFPDKLLNNPFPESVHQPNNKQELYKGLKLIRESVNNLFNEKNFASANGKSEHPGLLFLSAAEWLQFAEMHMRHHFRQKKRIDAFLLKAE